MTLAISTSSPLVSVSLYSGEEAIVSRSELARQNASYLVASWVAECVPDFGKVKRIVVDIGPGGFTGVKIGVTMAQMFAFSQDIDVYTVTAFDLISPDLNVAIPYKRGSYCVRDVGSTPQISSDLSNEEYCGYGIDGEPDMYPVFDPKIIERYIFPIALDKLVPLYVAEPSISTPKQPFASL